MAKQRCHTYVENNTVQLLLDAERRWTACELVEEVRLCFKTLPHSLHDIVVTAKLQLHEISKMQQWHRYAIGKALLDRYQREGEDFLRRFVALD